MTLLQLSRIQALDLFPDAMKAFDALPALDGTGTVVYGLVKSRTRGTGQRTFFSAWKTEDPETAPQKGLLLQLKEAQARDLFPDAMKALDALETLEGPTVYAIVTDGDDEKALFASRVGSTAFFWDHKMGWLPCTSQA